MDLVRLDRLGGLGHVEQRVVDGEGEGERGREDVLEVDVGVGGGLDEEGSLGLGGRAGARQRDGVVAADGRGEGEVGAGVGQAGRLEGDLERDLDARGRLTGRCSDALVHFEVRVVHLERQLEHIVQTERDLRSKK